MQLLSLIFIIGLTIKSSSQFEQSITLFNNIRITYTYKETQTNFLISTPLGNGVTVNNAWLGFGLNAIENMEYADVVLCTNLLGSTSVQRYRNIRSNSILLETSNPSLGLSNVSLTVNQGNMICSFTRDNTNSNSYTYNLYNNSMPHLLVAYGQGSVNNHGNNKYVTPNTVTFTYSKPQNSASAIFISKTICLLVISMLMISL